MARGRSYKLIRIIVISILANAIYLALITFFLGDLRFPNEHKTVYTTRTAELGRQLLWNWLFVS